MVSPIEKTKKIRRAIEQENIEITIKDGIDMYGLDNVTMVTKFTVADVDYSITMDLRGRLSISSNHDGITKTISSSNANHLVEFVISSDCYKLTISQPINVTTSKIIDYLVVAKSKE